MKFRSKLMLSYLLLVVLITGTFYIFYTRNLHASLVEESKVNLMNQAILVKMLAEGQEISASPQQLAATLGAAVKARVTLIAPDGKVTGDSDVNRTLLAGMENHLDRPEVQAALKGGVGSVVRYSETIRRDMLYVALKTDTRHVGTGFIRLALPLDYLTHAISALQHALGLIAVVTVLAALVLSYILSNLASRPLREMAEAAGRIGRGESGVTLAVTTRDEVGELGEVLNDMARRIDNQVRRLSAEKQRLDTILSGMGEGVMVASGDGVIALVNPAFCALFGISGAVEGKHLIEISRHPGLLAAFTELRTSGAGEMVREITIAPAGITVLTHWAPLVVDGDPQGVVAVFHDISDMKRVENMRRDFVANVSHELRTPVSVIKGYAETLLDGLMESDPERSRHFVEIIRNHSERLTSLINDILVLSHLESKETSLNLAAIDVAGPIAKACLVLEEGMAQKRIILKNGIPEGLPRVMADQGRLEQVLINLLENAVKYTATGGTISLFSQDLGRYMRISVADTGIGIPAKDLGRIFERFYRVDEARSREQGGTGLGLAIVKHIVQLHGGELSVSSEPGSGSVFSFTLPKD